MSLFSNSRSFLALILAVSSVTAQFAHYPDRYLFGPAPSQTEDYQLVKSFDECESLCQQNSACFAYTSDFNYDNPASFGKTFGRCFQFGPNWTQASLINFAHYSFGYKGTTCEQTTPHPMLVDTLSPSYCKTSRIGEGPDYSVYNYHKGVDVGVVAQVTSALACQALCNDTPACQAYWTEASLEPSQSAQPVVCHYNIPPEMTQLRGLGVLTGVKGFCANNVDRYSPSQQAACYDSPLMIFASARARARARRSLPSTNVISTCRRGETSCPIKRVDGTFSIGHECVDLRAEVSSCGSCGYDCAEHMGAGVLFSGCNRGKCEAVSCKGRYELDLGTSTCVPIV